MPPKQPRVRFVCDNCSGPGDLSRKHFNTRKHGGLPILCLSCRTQANHAYHRRGMTGCQTEGSVAARKSHTMEVGKCILVATDYGRCMDYYTCPDAKACLSAAAGRNWSGFTKMEGGMKCK